MRENNVNNEDDDDNNNDAKLIFMMRLPSIYSLRAVQAPFDIGLRNAFVVVMPSSQTYPVLMCFGLHVR